VQSCKLGSGESVPSRGCPSRMHLKLVGLGRCRLGALRKDSEGCAGDHQELLFALVIL
jgi:hypothetical protein